MSALEQFFYGNLDPQSRTSIHPHKLRKTQQRLCDLQQQLLQQLTDPAHSLFLQFDDAWQELNAQSDLDSFVAGFRMGAQITLDAFISHNQK